jgi:hypothetical protein
VVVGRIKIWVWSKAFQFSIRKIHRQASVASRGKIGVAFCDFLKFLRNNPVKAIVMAQASGSPDDSARLATLPWTPGDTSETAAEALQALDTYKKKDPFKGQHRC